MALELVVLSNGQTAWVDPDTGETMSAVGTQTTAPEGTKLDDWLTIAKQGLNLVQTQQLNQINVARAKQGLPPIDTSRYTGMGVNLGLTPQTQQLVMYGGLALLAVLLINNLTKR
ncbi:MAG: hypothetical protein EBU33_00950 [Sphingobacteriia bacterium]|nr:hypothetical protein [Sphingobacteriia bacterium]